ncbi:hypothetical protein B0H17DRAFT_1129249 [Mycena rosella]|uniref:Uncharacterized protein n=1 Tax=Mycena rosella TaxID=1033263 RepID=A0AAD7DTX3_MYCRO|nr:hypothetical protein B0H17DRAFT_1129249 [Mycena rosella]
MSFAPPLHPNVQLSTKLLNFYFNRRDGNHLSSTAVCDIRIETGRESVKFKCMFTQKEAEHKSYIIGNYKFKCSANRATRNQPEVGDERRDFLSDIGPWLPQFSLNDPWRSTGTLLMWSIFYRLTRDSFERIIWIRALGKSMVSDRLGIIATIRPKPKGLRDNIRPLRSRFGPGGPPGFRVESVSVHVHHLPQLELPFCNQRASPALREARALNLRVVIVLIDFHVEKRAWAEYHVVFREELHGSLGAVNARDHAARKLRGGQRGLDVAERD